MAHKSASSDSFCPRTHDAWVDHRRWLDLAEKVAEMPVSKGGSSHPSVKVGAVLVDSKGKEISSASNRFAQGVDRRRPERYKEGSKSLWINCAEQLALMQAVRVGKKLKGTKLYVTLEPCAVCAGMIAELGIDEVYVPVNSMRRYAKLKAKWKESIEIGLVKLQEACVRLVSVDTCNTRRSAK